MIKIKISAYLGHLVVGLHSLVLLLVLEKLLVLLLLLLRVQTAPILIILLGIVHEVRDNVNRDWEDDGGVVLGGDAVQRLQIPELKQQKVE